MLHEFGNRRKAAIAIRSLVSAKNLLPKYGRVLHEGLVALV